LPPGGCPHNDPPVIQVGYLPLICMSGPGTKGSVDGSFLPRCFRPPRCQINSSCQQPRNIAICMEVKDDYCALRDVYIKLASEAQLW